MAVRTPLVDSPALSKRFGKEVYLKLECFQPIRVFKIRGAYNKISQTKENSVVAVSSGNHGIATAFSARAFGKKCTVILPENPVQEKADAIAEYGATILKFGKYHNEREAKANEIVKETGAALIHPFNDPADHRRTGDLRPGDSRAAFRLRLGRGSGRRRRAGLGHRDGREVEEAQGEGLRRRAYDRGQADRALKAGKIISVQDPHSIADGLIPPSLGDLTFEACSKYVDGVFMVSDDEILAAMKADHQGSEDIPGAIGAAGIAALLAGRDTGRLGNRIVFVISGGNVSQKLLAQVLAS